MPKVGKQKFPYTSGGVQKAQKHAKETGQKVDMSEYKKGGRARAGRNINIGKSTPQSGGRGRSISGRKHAKGVAEARHKANLPAARTQSRIAQRTTPKSTYARSKGKRPAWATSGQSGGRSRPDAAYKHEKGIGTTKYSPETHVMYSKHVANNPNYYKPSITGSSYPVSTTSKVGSKRLGINKKKGGAVKKKYHHGGRVMAGQKKPKKC